MFTDSDPQLAKPRSRISARSMTIDLSSLPPLQLPTPPTNALIITNLNDPIIFQADNLLKLKDTINKAAPIHSWAPLKSFHRIIVTFFSIEEAQNIRQSLDGKDIMGVLVKIYFGHSTPIEPKDEHLNLPDAGKLFFISPPPSPPHGWQVRLEDAPNKQVMAMDLAEALAKLHTQPLTRFPESPISDPGETGSRTRSGSSTLLYKPEEHGCSPDLPAINVEDTTGDDSEISPIDFDRPIFAHTSLPPIKDDL